MKVDFDGTQKGRWCHFNFFEVRSSEITSVVHVGAFEAGTRLNLAQGRPAGIVPNRNFDPNLNLNVDFIRNPKGCKGHDDWSITGRSGEGSRP